MTSSSSDTARSTTRRDPYLDNAKAVLITLVVVGHFIEWISHGSSDALFKWIYVFHMPAFVFLSGYFSQRFGRRGERDYLSVATALLIPYLILQFGLALEGAAKNGHFSFNVFTPSFAAWYLLALALWRLATPLLKALPHPLILSILVSIASVLYGGVGLELTSARLLSFLPFFTAGLLVTPEAIERWKTAIGKVPVRIGAGAILVVGFAAIYVFRAEIVRPWLFMYGMESKFGLTNVENIVVRVCVLAAAGLAVACVLALIPRHATFFTYVGVNSLYVYILHSLVIYPFDVDVAHLADRSVFLIPVVVLAAVVLAFVLATRPVIAVFGWIADPVGYVRRIRARRQALAVGGGST